VCSSTRRSSFLAQFASLRENYESQTGRGLVRAAEFVAEPMRFTAYDDEDVATRTPRRARAWTPARLGLGG